MAFGFLFKQSAFIIIYTNTNPVNQICENTLNIFGKCINYHTFKLCYVYSYIKINFNMVNHKMLTILFNLKSVDIAYSIKIKITLNHRYI